MSRCLSIRAYVKRRFAGSLQQALGRAILAPGAKHAARTARFGIVLLLSALASPAGAATISLVADTWCPYNCRSNAERPGYLVEIAQQVFGKAGHTVEYRTLPWARAVAEARKGLYDAVIGASVEGSAKDFVFPEQATGSAKNVFLVKQGVAWRYTGTESLERIRIGVTLNYSYGSSFDTYLAANRSDRSKILSEAGDDALAVNLRKLELGQIDALIEDEAVLGYRLSQKNSSEHYQFAGGLERRNSYIAFSPAKASSAEYAKLLSAGTVELRRSGELEKILGRYGLKDWAP